MSKDTILHMWNHIYGTFLIGYILSLLLALGLIPVLKKIKFGQSIREDGPAHHQKKAGTPTIGGIVFLFAFLGAVLFVLENKNPSVVFLVAAVFGFGAIGFVDDYIKVVLKRNLGLRAKQKLVAQIGMSVFLAFWAGRIFGTEVYIPFLSQPIDLGGFYYILVVIVALGTTNGVNLTDGLDGLSAGVSGIVIGTLSLLAGYFSNEPLFLAGMGLVGGLAGFLNFNRHPAKVFMGDTGSLALGGAVLAMSLAMDMALFIPIFGGVFFVEALSVIIQVVSYKTRKKRVFRMAPLHHHFELGGATETQVVYGFYIAALGLCYIGYIIVKTYIGVGV